jgi:hypothetical protein
MSKLDDLQKQYRDYKNAAEAIESIRPKPYRVYYGADENHEASDMGETILFDAQEGSVYIRGNMGGCMSIPPESIKPLIKALTDLCGDTGKEGAAE